MERGQTWSYLRLGNTGGRRVLSLNGTRRSVLLPLRGLMDVSGEDGSSWERWSGERVERWRGRGEEGWEKAILSDTKRHDWSLYNPFMWSMKAGPPIFGGRRTVHLWWTPTHQQGNHRIPGRREWEFVQVLVNSRWPVVTVSGGPFRGSCRSSTWPHLPYLRLDARVRSGHAAVPSPIPADNSKIGRRGRGIERRLGSWERPR